MVYILLGLIILCCYLIIYLIRMRLQIRSINHQLDKRAKDESRQLVTLSFHNHEMIELASNMNRCLKAIEDSLHKERRNEQEFKQMIANLSHDLRTPLTAIRGYLQLLHNNQLTEQEEKNLEVAIRYTDKLGQLIEHFFEYTYLLDASPAMNLETINLTNLVIETLADAVNLFEKQGIEIEVIESAPVMANVDQEMTTRIVQNLIRNCLTHSGGNLKVLIEQAEMAEIHFSNPIREGDIVDPESIFDRFYTSDASRRNSTGLGLSIVKLLSEKMGGSASARVEDRNLEIIITLPQNR